LGEHITGRKKIKILIFDGGKRGGMREEVRWFGRGGEDNFDQSVAGREVGLNGH